MVCCATLCCGRSRGSSVYRGPSAGPRVFLPFGSRDPASGFFSSYTGRRMAPAPSINSSLQPVSWVFPRLSALGLRPVPLSQIPSDGGVFCRGMPSDILLGGFAWPAPSSSVIPVSSGSPLGGGIPPGDCPSPRCPSVSGRFWRHRLFSRLRAGGRFPVQALGEVRLASFADVPFSRLSASPFLSRFTSRQGLSAVAFSVFRGEPLG